MAKQVLNVGTSNNDKSGDTLRAGGLKIKANFDEIYNALGNGTNITGGNLLKTGTWTDVLNKPTFHPISLSGSFDDLEDKPDLVAQIGTPETLFGSIGDLSGRIAYDANNLYVSTADYTDGSTPIWKYVPWGGSGTTQGYRYTHNENPIATGGFSLDNSDPSLATVAYVATTDISNNDIHPFYQYVTDNSLNANLEVISATNPQNRALFHITGITELTASGIEYYELQLTYIMHTAGMTIGSGVWDLHFDFTGTAGNANTGDITFNGVKVIGAGTASGDGYGYSTIELVPDNSLYSNGQYLVIDPTAPSHIHIRAGGLQDQSPADLFLGGEKNHVRTRDNQGVRIQNIQTTDNFWYYVDTTDFTSGSWYTESGNHYVEFTTTNAQMVSKFWDFTNGGPNRVRLNDGDEIEYGGSGSNPTPNVYKVQVLTAPPSSPTSLTSIEFHIFVDNTNYLYLENNDFRVDVADDIRMYARDVFSLRNYSVEEPIDIITDYDGNAWTWNFSTDGNLRVPKAINFQQNATIPLAAPAANGVNDRITLWDFNGSGTGFNYAIGAEGNHIWFTMDVNNGTGGFKFYSRDNQVFKIRDDGVLIFEDSSTFNVTVAPTTSKGQTGDKAGTVAFDATYMYYCKQNYAASSISVTALASAGVTVWIDSADYTGDLVADFTANSTGWTYNGVTITAVSADNTFGPGYALTGTTGFSVVNGNNYTLVSPNLPDIWKRVAWSNDTW